MRVIPTSVPSTAGSPTGSPGAYVRASSELDRANVRWLRLRDRGDGDEDDVLVAPEDLPAARRALGVAGFHERPQPGHGTHHAFFAYDPATGAWAKLDVVTRIDLGPFQEWRTSLAEGCLARRIDGPDGARPSADDAFWTLLLHELVDRPFRGIRREANLRLLAPSARVDGDGAMFVRGITGAWTPQQIVEMVSDGDGGLADLARSIRAGLTARSPFAVRIGRLRARIARRLAAMEPPFVRQGLTVALLGPDGAGKSSLAMTVGDGAPMATRSIYLGLYGGPRGARRGGRRVTVRGLGTVRRLVAMWRGWLIGWWHARRGRLVLFDRHPYDARLGAPARGLARVRRGILARALPAPDLVIVLDAAPELLFGRKPEHPLAQIEEQRKRYLDLAARTKSAVVVDVGGSLEEVTHRVRELVGHALASRARRR
jgi:thymidylate kinase